MRKPFKVKLLRSFFQRLLGLEFKRKTCDSYLFLNCNCIHTFGMRKPIDVAFLALDGRVLQVNREVKASRVISNKDAINTVERFSCASHWLVPGERYVFEEV